MKPRLICNNVYWVGAIDWDRRLFDSLIPLPDGTSYNAYLVKGSEKTALIDTVDPEKAELLYCHLAEIDTIDYIISNHTEQDHSGMIPELLKKYPMAQLIASPKAKTMLADHLLISPEKIRAVEDCETISLGDKTLEFIHTPWVHWPETMSTYLKEDAILFSCDFFGSHLATSDLFSTADGFTYEAAKRYFAEIMLPFRSIIKKNIEKVESRDVKFIAPSHGPIHANPKFMIDAYKDWISDTPKNEVIVAYVSMHGSTKKMVECLVDALVRLDVKVHRFDMQSTDLGKLAIALVDAATIVLATPTVLVGPHPAIVEAAFLGNALRPKARFAAILNSYGWASKAVEQLSGMLTSLKPEVLGVVSSKGYPRKEHCDEIEKLAETIAAKHKEIGAV